MDFSRDAAVRLGAAMLLAVVFGGGAALGFAIDRDNGSEIRESPSIPDVPRPDRSQRPSEWIIDRLGSFDRAAKPSRLGRRSFTALECVNSKRSTGRNTA